MELLCDTPLSMDKVFEILVKVREEGHVDKLNYFNEGHSLDVLSREDIETKLHKSFDIDVVSLSRIFGKALEVTELIRFAHYAIETANNVEKEKGKKRKTGQGSSESKKLKKADELEVSSFIFFNFFFQDIYIFLFLKVHAF